MLISALSLAIFFVLRRRGIINNIRSQYGSQGSIPDEQYRFSCDYLEGVVDHKPEVQDGVGPGGRGQGDRHAGLGAERLCEFCHRVERQESIERLGIWR